ncbi:MAG: SRPBCC family protein [Actinomycetota bacterium]|nr:SRPBCC family protein [Actinomycetota bacterium]
MSTVSTKIEIDASPEVVWDTIMDPSCLGDWVTIHKSVRNASQSPLSKGATMDQTMVLRGVTFRVHWTLVSVDRPHQAQWEGIGPAHSRARIEYGLSESGKGGTIFEYTNEFHPPGGRLGHVAGRVIVGGTSEREAKNSLSKLKALLEKAN